MHPNIGKYKPDWQEARGRMVAWWTGKKTDRVPAQVSAPVKPANPRVASSCDDVPAKYTDPETVLRNMEYRLEHTFWGGESFPTQFSYFGPMFCLAFLGCEPHFMPDTTWYEPCLRDWSELPNMRFDPNNRWWQLSKEMMRLSAERAEGRWLVACPMPILALMDVICGLLGNEKTLMAMAEQPAAVKAARDRMMPWARQTYDEAYNIGRRYQEGSSDWMQIWAPGRAISSQCDMSVMISPEMFRDFVVPELADIYNHVDYGIYHLDGPEQIRHLDELLKIEKLHLVQWVPGARMNNLGHCDPLNWIDLFRRIQAAGKKVLIYCPPERVQPLLDKIARDRVILNIGCQDEQTARNVLRELDGIGV
jgi:hypothetical protein